MRIFTMLICICLAPSALQAGESPLIEVEAFKKDIATEPLTDCHLFSERVKAYVQQMTHLESKKYPSTVEKTLLKKMVSEENLKWLFESATARLDRMAGDLANPTIQLTDPADLTRSIVIVQHTRFPKTTPLPPAEGFTPKFQVDIRQRAIRPLTDNDWKRVLEWLNRHMKHLDEKKYDTIFSRDYATPPTNKEEEIKILETPSRKDLLKAFLQARESAFYIPGGALVVIYFPSTCRYWELVLTTHDHQGGEYCIDKLTSGLTQCVSRGVFVDDGNKK